MDEFTCKKCGKDLNACVQHGVYCPVCNDGCPGCAEDKKTLKINVHEKIGIQEKIGK